MAQANFHENLTSQDAIELGSNRKFGLVVGGIFALIGIWLLHQEMRAGYVVAPLGVCLVLGGLVYPSRLTPIHRGWMKFGVLLHHIISPIIMVLLYALAIIPTGFLMRIFAADPMRRRKDPKAASYWITRDPVITPESMKRQF